MAAITPVKWSPAWEVMELCRGEDPEPPDGPIDMDYAQALRGSHQTMRGLEAYKDLMRKIKDLEDKLTTEWTETKKGSEMNARAVKVLRYVRKASEFSERRFDTLIVQAEQQRAHEQKRSRA